MTYEEIYKKYKELFIMLVEKAGRETKNTSYLNVEKILGDDNFRRIESDLLENERPFQLVVCCFIVNIFLDIYGPKTLSDWDTSKSYNKLQEFYKLYLRIPTIQFCSKYGLESFDEIEFNFGIFNLN